MLGQPLGIYLDYFVCHCLKSRCLWILYKKNISKGKGAIATVHGAVPTILSNDGRTRTVSNFGVIFGVYIAQQLHVRKIR